jgi:protein-disulfide isomerase
VAEIKNILAFQIFCILSNANGRKGDGGAAIAQNLYKIGRIAGLDQSKMEVCLQDKDVATAMVARFQETTKADNVSSTPSLILNGKNIGNMSYTELAALIEEAMP